MNAIWKFPMQLGSTTLVMPRGAVIRRFAMQGDVPTVWAEVDTTIPTSIQRVKIVGTGHPIPDGAVYIDTCDHGPFVWHLFETI